MTSTAPVSARAIALDLIDAVLHRGRLLDDAVETDPRLAQLEDRDRAFARLLAATTLRRLGQLDDVIGRCLDRPLPARASRVGAVIRLGASQLLFLDTPPHAAISTSVDLTKAIGFTGLAGLVNAVLRRLDRDGRAWIAAQDGARINMPDWLWQSWVQAYGPDTAAAIAAAHMIEAPLDLSTAGDPALWAERLSATPMPTGTLRRFGGGDVRALPGFAEGAWWVQDLAAALPARLLGDVGGLSVADLCAAPGGKTLQLAAAGARVTAADKSRRRLTRLTRNLERLGLDATIVEGDMTAWTPPEPFDAVLLDAPCSATGTLRRHPDGLRLKRPGDGAALARSQRALLSAAAAMVRPGGRLIYCVCSLDPAEGEQQIATFLADTPAMSRDPITAAELPGLEMAVTPQGEIRTLPHYLADQGGMDGFFIARLRRM